MQTANSLPPVVPAKTNGLAITSLVLGILSPFCLFFVTGIPAVICGIVGMNQVARSGGTQKGRGQALAGAILGGVGTLATPMLAILAGIMLPALGAAREKARTVQCMSNLRQIGVACIVYANENGNRLPPDLSSLSSCGVAAPVLTCTSDPQKAGAQPGYSSYQYFGRGMTLSAVKNPSLTVLACERGGNHRNAVNILFADSHVETLRGAVTPPLMEQADGTMTLGAVPSQGVRPRPATR